MYTTFVYLYIIYRHLHLYIDRVKVLWAHLRHCVSSVQIPNILLHVHTYIHRCFECVPAWVVCVLVLSNLIRAIAVLTALVYSSNSSPTVEIPRNLKQFNRKLPVVRLWIKWKPATTEGNGKYSIQKENKIPEFPF